MESINLDMEDLFDNDAVVHGDDDEDMTGGQSLHNMEDDENQDPQATQNEGEDGDVLSKLRDLSKGAAKKKVMKPQPKLDHVRLTGDRGIPMLPRMFENIKFKGKGHEAEDLKRMMSMFEHWAHRLFPKMTFDEVIERSERLGAKKAVQTCVKRMRLDMPILDEDFVSRQGDEEDADGQNNSRLQDSIDADAEEVLDEMMEAEASSQHPPQQQESSDDDAFEAMMQEEAMRSQRQPVIARSQETEPLSPPISQQTEAPSASNSLSTEQKERMERNRCLAMEKRLARLASSSAAKTSNKGDTPSSNNNTLNSDIKSNQSEENNDTKSQKSAESNDPVNEESTTQQQNKIMKGKDRPNEDSSTPELMKIDQQHTDSTDSKLNGGQVDDESIDEESKKQQTAEEILQSLNERSDEDEDSAQRKDLMSTSQVQPDADRTEKEKPDTEITIKDKPDTVVTDTEVPVTGQLQSTCDDNSSVPKEGELKNIEEEDLKMDCS